MLDSGAVRKLFPGVEGRAYLDAASLGLASTRTVDAVREMAGQACRPTETETGAQHVRLGRMRAGARPALARILGVDARSIALVENTSMGLALAAAAIPLGAGDNVVLGRSDYLQTSFVWRRRPGVELRFVAPRAGLIEPADVAAAMDRRTRAVCLSSVQWTSGQRLDLEALSSLTRERAAWLVVDGAQHVGGVRLDLSRTAVDFLACSGHKWLGSPFGCGFLHVGPRAAAELEPPLAGLLAARPPAGGWGAYFADPDASAEDLLELAPGGRAWETGGTPNFPGAVALRASVELLLKLGPAEVEEHILRLSGRLMDRLAQMGAGLVTPRDDEARAGIVTFHWGDGLEDEQAAWRALVDADVQLSLRYGGGVGGLRAAVHLYNDETDVDRLVDVLETL